jgi:hypothetical protein
MAYHMGNPPGFCSWAWFLLVLLNGAAAPNPPATPPPRTFPWIAIPGLPMPVPMLPALPPHLPVPAGPMVGGPMGSWHQAHDQLHAGGGGGDAGDQGDHNAQGGPVDDGGGGSNGLTGGDGAGAGAMPVGGGAAAAALPACPSDGPTAWVMVNTHHSPQAAGGVQHVPTQQLQQVVWEGGVAHTPHGLQHGGGVQDCAPMSTAGGGGAGTQHAVQLDHTPLQGQSTAAGAGASTSPPHQTLGGGAAAAGAGGTSSAPPGSPTSSTEEVD